MIRLLLEAPRTIKVKCATWDQVEAFYTQKVKGDLFIIRMPQPPRVGQPVTVALVLPNGLVFAMDGEVTKLGPLEEGGKAAVAMKLSGLTAEARLRLVRLVDEGRRGSSPNLTAELSGMVSAASSVPVPSPTPSDAPVDEPVSPPVDPQIANVDPAERKVFAELVELRKRQEPLAAHEVIGVAEEAPLVQVRKGYFALAKRYHPDAYGRYRSAAVRQLASEVFLHVNKAYDRLRQARAELGDSVPGPARRPQIGWFAEIAPFVAEAPTRLPADADELNFDSAVRTPLTPADLLQAELNEPAESPADVFAPKARDASTPPPIATQGQAETEGRDALANGRWEEAREKLAEALRGDPRNRKLRALYHVASGMEMRVRGKDTEAQIHFETALRHDRECAEARRALQKTEDRKGLFSRFWGR
jgi:hypothetical protein